MLQELFPNDVFSIFAVFARVGAAVMLLPGFGESYVSPSIRLLFGVALTVVITPVVAESLPPRPETPIEMVVVVLGEIVIGLFIGALARFLISALHIAGVIIGFQTSLANAQFFDPANAQQGSMTGAFLNLIGIFLIFTTDLHHLMLLAITDSYTLFVPGAAPPVGDFTDLAAHMVSDSFSLGMKIAAPFIVVGLVFYIGLGLIARLMPQVQVFFIALPLQLLLGFLIMMLTLSAAMLLFLNKFEQTMHGFIGL